MVAKKSAAKKPAPKKSAAQKPPAKKSAPKKSAPKKSAAQKPAAKKPPAKTTAAKKSTTDARPGPPKGFKLSEWKPGHFFLILVGPGYAWEKVCDDVAPAALKKRFKLDCEGGMFSASGTDRAALEELRALLEPCLTDREKFNAVQKAARQEGNV